MRVVQGGMPTVIAAYQKWHEKNFEIIGSASTRRVRWMLTSGDRRVVWRQVCDEGFWDAEIADLGGSVVQRPT